MKHHHIAALFCIIFAGLFLYQGFHDWEMESSIWTGIALVVLGVVVFFSRQTESMAEAYLYHVSDSFS